MMSRSTTQQKRAMQVPKFEQAAVCVLHDELMTQIILWSSMAKILVIDSEAYMLNARICYHVVFV